MCPKIFLDSDRSSYLATLLNNAMESFHLSVHRQNFRLQNVIAYVRMHKGVLFQEFPEPRFAGNKGSQNLNVFPISFQVLFLLLTHVWTKELFPRSIWRRFFLLQVKFSYLLGGGLKKTNFCGFSHIHQTSWTLKWNLLEPVQPAGCQLACTSPEKK